MKKSFGFLVVFCLLFSSMFSQTLEEAKEMYKLGEYKRALPAFEREYKEKPGDASLNQWYGVCLFETGGDFAKAKECITLASKKNIQDAYLYLGKIYTKEYLFDAATKEFDRYAKLKRRDKEALARLDEAKRYLSLMERASSRPEDIQIIDSIVVNKADFLQGYKLSPYSGELKYYTDNKSTVYLNEKKDKMYYAKALANGNYSLFSMEKLLDDFGNEKRLTADNFELTGSLNYPFVLSDGVTLYFSAQDENNFGGYDIYVTRYNLNNDTYLAPERLNMPFNSSFNDYMYVVDEEKGVGWFASDRFQPEGKVCIYTFIPNASVELVENDDDNYLVNRARIKSIMESWKPGVNYAEIRALAKKEIVAEIQVKKDFEFVINDKYTYYSLKDFKDQAAKNLYAEILNKKKSLAELDNRLNSLRNMYASSAASASAQEILKLENDKGLLSEEIDRLEVQARNQEITSARL